MRQIAIQNKSIDKMIILNSKGLTLVEVMIAMVILLIVFMGLVQASLVSINSNTRNVLRDEAVRITSDELTRIRASAYDDMDRSATADSDPLNFNRNTARTFRNMNIPYTVAITICAASCGLDAEHKQITITTTWAWQGETFTHQIMTTRRI
jgi:type IV pilus assembly protein PilV